MIRKLKKAQRSILFTFDYELFLGSRSGSVSKCLIEPTGLLLDLFEKYKIKGSIFFVDTTYLLRLKSEPNTAAKADYVKIVDQLKLICEKGHFIFPHIHPHWADAKYVEGANYWSLTDFSKYRFHHVFPELREELFSQSVNLLKEIVDTCSVKFPVNAYRAGGWSLQPFEDFKPSFEKHHISHEFSVVPGFKNLSDAQYFDFSECPDKVIYKFDSDPTKEAENGVYTEYTISTIEISKKLYWRNKVWLKYLWKTGQRSMGDGVSLVIKDKELSKGRKEMLGSANREMISIELLNLMKLREYKIFLEKNSYMHFISHPKMISLHNLKTFERFLKYAISKYILMTDFNQLR